MEIFYDGQCPFCRGYMQLVKLRRSVGEVELIDARSGDPRIAAVREAGLGLDEGMVVRHGGRFWHGDEAISLLATLTDPQGPIEKLVSLLLRDRARARRLYPWLRAGRGATLRLLGRGRIDIGKGGLS